MRGLWTLLIFAVMSCLSVPASVQAADADPSAPELFMPNPDQGSGFWDRIGPANAAVRKNSTKADVHRGVEGFAHARYCLSCHVGQDKNLHYARTDVQCKTCHISRPLAGIRNPAATMFSEHRAEKVCAECHQGATLSMAEYVIHEPVPFAASTRSAFPALFWSAWAMVILAVGVFAVFAPYVAAWAVREVRLILKPATQMPAPGPHIERFGLTERLFHTVLTICFMVLSVTGLAWMFIETGFGQFLAGLFGNYQGAIWAHRWVGLVLMCVFVLHLFYILHMARRQDPGGLTGPDSLVWKWADFRAFWHHLKWLAGMAEHPAFDRWAWWQKFDYWAVWWGTLIVGVTGLVMFDPVLTSEYLPGWTLNVARWVHKIEALLAMAHIFIVHFFIESYRPRAFPLNDHVFHGAADLETLRHEHPEWIARLEADGRVDELIVEQPPRAVQAVYFLFGVAMVALGVFLLIGAAWNFSSLS